MVEPVVSILLRRLHRELDSSVLQMSSFTDEIARIKSSLLTIKSFAGDAEEKQESDGAIRRWLKVAVDAVYDLDDLTDEMVTATTLPQMSVNLKKLPKVCMSWFSSGEHFAYFLTLGPKIKKTRENLEYLVAEGLRLKLVDLPIPIPIPNELYPNTSFTALARSSVPKDKLIGNEEEKKSIIKLLTESNVNDRDHVPIIPIMGMGGLGKTTLARSVYNEEQVVRHFEIRAWVCVSDTVDADLISKKIIESVVNYNIGSLGIDQARYHLRDVIGGRKFLIVLDDIWGNSLCLKTLMLDIGGIPGSRVLITTRDKSVGESLGAVQPLVLRGLDEENSWSLFKHVAFQQGQEPLDSGIVDIGKEIIRKCAGIPLVIKIIGSLLYFQNSEPEWLVLDHELTKLTHNKEFDVLSILKSSYHHLPSHLKPCFFYFSMFRKDHRYDVNTLVNLWMAEGLIETLDCSRLEDVGQGYVMELFWRSFLQEKQEDEWGSISSFKLHDLVHDLAMLVASGKNNSVDSDVMDVDKTVRRASLNFGSLSLEQIPTRIPEPHKLRTLLNSQSWLPFEHKSIKLNLSSLIQGFKSLRVLDLQDLGMEMVPSCIGDLAHLRYLNLSKNRMIRIPSSITKLLHLQTLKLSYCRFLKELPRGIGKMVKLRHLEISGCDNLQHMPSGLGKLISLQVLSRFVLTKGPNSVSRGGSKLQELGKLNNLRGNLDILHLEHVEQLGDAFVEEAKGARLKEKPLLRLLALKWCRLHDDCDGIYKDDKVLEYLSPHLNLKSLFIRGYRGLGFPSWCSSLTNLVDFTLHNCSKCKCLPQLHQLPFLKNLELVKLDSLEYISDSDVDDFMPHASIFPSLKKLTVFDCRNLRCWWKRNTYNDFVRSFHCLSKLEIRYCPQLVSIPLFPNLDEELILVNVSAKLMQETMMMTATTMNMTAQEEPAKMEVPNSSSTCFSTSFPPALSKLKSMHIANIEDLETFPYEWLRNLTSLQSMNISACGKLKSFSQGIQHLSSLVYLKIKDCKELHLYATEKDSMVWQVLKSLRSLTIWGLPKQKSLPSGLQYLTSLQFLQLYNCSSVIALPEWIGNLSSLNRLVISKCYNLASLPNGMRTLTSLHTLIVVDCPLLLPRCQPRTGEDWLKIANVPNFSLRPVFKDFSS